MQEDEAEPTLLIEEEDNIVIEEMEAEPHQTSEIFIGNHVNLDL